MPQDIILSEHLTEGLVLALDNVGKTFASNRRMPIQALDHLDLRVKEGEFVALIGPTGCGKTTVLNIVAGLEAPSEGAVRRADGLSPERDIAFVFQHYTLFPWRRVLRNVTFGLEMRRAPRVEREAIAKALLREVGLQGFERAFPHELSGGMRQRAAIAQALATHPRMILMDEPFGALDELTREALQEMLSDLWLERRPTVLFVTHNVEEAIIMADRVAVMRSRPGRIISEINVNMPRPRNRLDSTFISICEDVRRILRTT